jgi:hypothetical protein
MKTGIQKKKLPGAGLNAIWVASKLAIFFFGSLSSLKSAGTYLQLGLLNYGFCRGLQSPGAGLNAIWVASKPPLGKAGVQWTPFRE